MGLMIAICVISGINMMLSILILVSLNKLCNVLLNWSSSSLMKNLQNANGSTETLINEAKEFEDESGNGSTSETFTSLLSRFQTQLLNELPKNTGEMK